MSVVRTCTTPSPERRSRPVEISRIRVRRQRGSSSPKASMTPSMASSVVQKSRRAASRSHGVACRFTIASRAPRNAASSGYPAAGNTVSDDPSTTTTSAPSISASATAVSRALELSPKFTIVSHSSAATPRALAAHLERVQKRPVVWTWTSSWLRVA
eukprot:Amastigsp_a508535_595.p4 type:complete len:157 gc:universal Amastigsp_a508535_595:541-1011(+)